MREASNRFGGATRAVGQEFFEHPVLGGSQLALEFADVHEIRLEGTRGEIRSGEVLEELSESKGGEGG